MVTRVTAIPFVFLGLLALACRAPFERGPAWTLRDSARTEIVESYRAAWPPNAKWSLSSSPDLVIGSEVGAATLFYNVTDAVLFRDGALAVANAGTGELRFFNASGSFVRAVGQDGDGPGEFRWIQSVSRYRGDSLFAYDNTLARGTIVDSEGVFGRTVSFLLRDRGRPRDVLPLSDGRFIVQRSGPTAGRAEQVVEGLVVNPAEFSLWSSEGVMERDLFSAPGDELFMLPPREGTDYIRFRVPLFARQAVAAVRDNLLLTAFGDSFSVAVISVDGRIGQILRRPGPKRAVGREEVDSTYVAMVGVPPNRELTYNLPYPETEPAFSRFLVDDDGYLWISEYAQYRESPEAWSVFHPDGMYLGDVRVPANTDLLDIGSTMAVGRARDELGVERIAVWRLIKPGTPERIR